MKNRRPARPEGGIIRWALSFGMTKGVFGGSRPWRIVFFGALAARTLKRFFRDQPDIVLTEKLGQGQAIVLTHEDVTFADDRRAQRAARRSAHHRDRRRP